MTTKHHLDGTPCAGETCAWAGDGGHHVKASLHVHSYSYSTDCDGPLERWGIVEYDGDPELNFWTALGFSISPVSANGNGPATVELNLTDEGRWTATIDQPLEEGGKHVELRECEEDDADEDPHQRDHYAEAMGY